jgi:cobalt-zinc-cadmium efflux system outer membrane protein
MQLRALALQARGNLVQSQNRQRTAWQQLAATLGLPDLPLTELAGTVETTIPVFEQNPALAWMLNTHTDVLSARNGVQRARYELRLAQVTPIPDVSVRVAVQRDYTTPPYNVANNIQIGVPLPVWDSNRGAIHQAQAALARATEEERRVRGDLTTRLAEAFERYNNNRLLAGYYRDHVLPDQSRVYSRTLLRFNTQSEKVDDKDKVAFVEVVNSQQLYVQAVATYAVTLRDLWQAVVDIAGLIQTEDLFLGLQATPAAETNCATPSPCH